MARQKIKRIISIPAQNVNLNVVEEKIRKEGGKIFLKNEYKVEFRFGNNLLIRLFGTGIIYNLFKKSLPARLCISSTGDLIEIKMEDNLGWYLMNDAIGLGSYNKLFDHLEKVILNKS